MLEYSRCNLCENDDYEVLYPSTITEGENINRENLTCSNLGHGRHHRIVRCKQCGLIYSNPRDSSIEIETLDKKVKDAIYYAASAARIKTFLRLLRRSEIRNAGRTLLDIGCYTGLFMKLARDKGFSVSGIEPSHWAANIGTGEYGLDIINASIYEVNIDKKFDLITMWDTLEHLVDPYRALRICHELLLSNGMIAISTMCCQGWFYSLCNKRWPWFMRMHIYYFTVSTLSRILERSGFRVIARYPYTHYIDTGYLFYKMSLKNRTLPDFSSNRLLKQIILPVQLGDFMEVYAVKEDISRARG